MMICGVDPWWYYMTRVDNEQTFDEQIDQQYLTNRDEQITNSVEDMSSSEQMNKMIDAQQYW